MSKWDTDAKQIIAKLVRAKLVGDIDPDDGYSQTKREKILSTPIEGCSWTEHVETKTYHILTFLSRKFLVEFDEPIQAYKVNELREGISPTESTRFMTIINGTVLQAKEELSASKKKKEE